jgi:hypothetical protein
MKLIKITIISQHVWLTTRQAHQNNIPIYSHMPRVVLTNTLPTLKQLRPHIATLTFEENSTFF